VSPRRIEIALWGVAALLLVIAGIGARSSPFANDRTASVGLPAAPALGESRKPTAEIRNSIADRDPFRLARHPSPVAYRPELEGFVPPPAQPRPPKPALVLTGMLGGPPWEALIEGIPEHNGALLVHEGDKFGDLRVRAIRRDSVIISSADTTWRLGLKRSWQ